MKPLMLTKAAPQVKKHNDATASQFVSIIHFWEKQNADPKIMKQVAGKFGLKPLAAIQVKNEIRQKYKVRPRAMSFGVRTNGDNLVVIYKLGAPPK